MAKTHYETLGVAQSAKNSDIKAAYRRLVLKHHPDRSKDPSAPHIFRGISEAFEVLGDPDERKRYDERLQAEAVRRRETFERQQAEAKQRKKHLEDVAAASRNQRASRSSSGAGSATRVRATALEVSEMNRRLSVLFARQKYSECEALARQIIQMDPRRPTPYAVLGDISRARGSLDDAARMYSFALQMEPTNRLYMKNYEDILDRTQSLTGKGNRVQIKPQERRVFAILAITAITLLGSMYVVLSPEAPFLGDIGPISTWTVGIVVMLFLAGASAGSALSMSNLIDRIEASSSGRISPTVLFGVIAILSFPVALFLYLMIGSLQKALTITSSRMMGTVAAITTCLALSGSASSGGISFVQTMLWGGNLVYLGAIAGWTVADSVRR